MSKVEPPIRYDHTIMDRFESARRELKEHIKNCLNTEQTKVGSRVTLRFDVVNSPALSPEQKELIQNRLATRIGKNGLLRIISQQTRSQLENRELAIERFAELLREALRQAPIRKKTRVSKGAKLRRLEEKKQHGLLKSRRSEKVPVED